jgi:hypothetical protein
MKSQLLKLDAPYQVIYAGGLVGRHIATMVTWTEDESGEMMDTVSYPIIDQGEEFPAGKMVMTDLDDCRCLCPPNGTNLGWVMKIIEYDFQQIDPASPEYILERMKLLGCKIVMPMEKDNETGEMVQRMYFKATLNIMPVRGRGKDTIYRVRSNRFEGFYFQSEGTAHDIYYDLTYQLSIYRDYFYYDIINIRFQTHDEKLEKVIQRLNADQHIEGFEHDDDYDF